MKYLILQHPGHNRVYYQSSEKMALAELKLACQKISATCTNIHITEIAGLRYYSFTTENPLPESDQQILSRLSFVFALFISQETSDNKYLLPLRRIPTEYLNSKISTLLKYQGKTNELFTKMMIHIALLSSDLNPKEKICMLDPVAGKGTTLFEGAVYGFDAYGIEIETKPVHEATVFFKKYLETERIKHRASTRQVSGKSKAEAVMINEFEYAVSKESFKTAGAAKKLGMVCGHAGEAHRYFKKEEFHLLVGDLPYGIFHNNNRERGQRQASRNPAELLGTCLPGWHKVLKHGGLAVLAWNTFVASRKKICELFTSNGFEVLSSEPYGDFEHMVDKSIKRDIIVARKP